jgi:prepilin-type N-terminal cleavage/methylation domain-containing protein
MLTYDDKRQRPRQGMQRGPRARAGFTLVEILMVVVILGIASAIIIPSIGTRDDMRASAAARVLIADLIFAQNQAITTGRKVFVRFDVADNKYSLCSAVSPGGDTYCEHPMTQSPYTQQFGPTKRGWEAITIDSAVMNGVDPLYKTEFTVAFDEIGSPFVYCYDEDQTNDLADGTIVLRAGQFTKVIRISAATGEISIDP